MSDIKFSNNDKYPHADVMLLHKVHNKLFKKLFLGYNDEKERRNSAELTNYFQKIKDYIQSNQKDTDNPLSDVFEQIVYDYVKPLNYAKKNLFNFNSGSGRKAGDKFEKVLAIICNAAIDALNSRTGNTERIIEAKQVGTTSVTANIVLSLEKDFRKQFDSEFAKVEPKIKNSDLVRFSKRSGKTDVSVSGGKIFEGEVEAQDFLANFVKLINGKSFTAKNYSDISNVGLGSTNPFRIYMSALAFIGEGHSSKTKDNLKIYYSTQKSLKHNRSGTKEHDFHIKSTYELIGVGQAIEIGQLARMPDYLIINERRGNKIQVYSTKMLIYDEIKNNKKRMNLDIDVKTGKEKIVFNSTVI